MGTFCHYVGRGSLQLRQNAIFIHLLSLQPQNKKHLSPWPCFAVREGTLPLLPVHILRLQANALDIFDYLLKVVCIKAGGGTKPLSIWAVSRCHQLPVICFWMFSLRFSFQDPVWQRLLLGFSNLLLLLTVVRRTTWQQF